MTNREKISKLIKANFPNIEVYWEQNGDMVKRDKNGVEIERHPAFGNRLVVTCPNSSEMGSIKWLNDEYKVNHADSPKETNDTIVNIINTVTEYMYCNWKDCHMEENMTWEDLQKVREEIKENAMDMIKDNLNNFLTKEYLDNLDR